MKRLMAVAATLLATACAGSSPPVDTAGDNAAITKVRDAYGAAWKAGDGAALGALFAADGRSMENQQATAVGPQGVQAIITEFGKQFTPTSIEITAEKTELVGDVAYERGTFKLSAASKAAGVPALADSGRYLVVLRRQADGSWKIAETMGNSATPPPMPAPANAKK